MLETLPDASEETEKTVINNIAKLLSRVRCMLYDWGASFFC